MNPLIEVINSLEERIRALEMKVNELEGINTTVPKDDLSLLSQLTMKEFAICAQLIDDSFKLSDISEAIGSSQYITETYLGSLIKRGVVTTINTYGYTYYSLNDELKSLIPNNKESLTHHELRLYTHMYLYMSKNREFRQPYKRIAESCCIGLSLTQRIIKSLIDKGAIDLLPGAKGATNTYRVN